MARKKYTADFETTTDPMDCRVWAYGWMEIGNTKNYKIGTSLDDFMEWVMKVKADIYFHNLKFDGSFIVNWLLHNGWKFEKNGGEKTFHALISKMGQWYMIDLCFGYKGRKKIHTVIYDSLKKLPFPVKKIAKDFKLEIRKGEIDYHKKRSIGYELDDEERAYIKNDIEIMAQALEIQFNQGLKKMTTGSDALGGFKDVAGKKIFEKMFPTFDVEVDSFMRKAYKGGFTWLKDEYREKEVGEGLVFDVNSLYPAMMYYKNMPYGTPEWFDGKYEKDDWFPLYIQKVRCEFELKKDHIPTIQIKGNKFFKENEYLKDSDGELIELFVTNVDWQLIQDHYDVYNVEYLGGWKFRSLNGIFNKYIDKWMYIKSTSDGAIRLLAKLMLNSLYGKFASNPDVTGKVPYLKEDGANGFREGEEEYKEPVYTPMGAFITAYARETSIRTAQKCYDRFIYCDTDSIHLTGLEIPEAIKDIVDDNQLGYWAYEGTFKRAKYIRQKTYYHELYVNANGKECTKEESVEIKKSVKCAGMPDSVKEKVTFDNFERGFTSGGKLLQKNVKGGVVLVDTDFTIK